MLTIQAVNNHEAIDLSHYELPIRQMIYSGHPRYIISRDKQDYHPYVIKQQDEIVGVFALEEGNILDKFNFPKESIYLRGLSINFKHQNKGYFKTVLQLILKEIHQQFPTKSNLYITVNVKNNAYFAFIKAGFIDERRTVQQGLNHLKVMKKHLS